MPEFHFFRVNFKNDENDFINYLWLSDYLKLNHYPHKNGVKMTVNGWRKFAANFNEKYFLVFEVYNFQETIFSQHMETYPHNELKVIGRTWETKFFPINIKGNFKLCKNIITTNNIYLSNNPYV